MNETLFFISILLNFIIVINAYKFFNKTGVYAWNNFRLFFPGLFLSQVGVWLQNIAISRLVYDMTKSAMTMGAVFFFNAAIISTLL